MSADEYDISYEDAMRIGEMTPNKRKYTPRHGLGRNKARDIRVAVGQCEICEEPLGLELDHEHDSNELRGVLCGDCNRRLWGKWEDPDVLRRAIAYLERPKSQRPSAP